MLNLSHKKLNVYKLAIELVKKVYKSSQQLPKEEVFGLSSQIRRSVVSIPSNIAEGCARKSKIEQKRFYEIARSSLVELDTQLVIAVELKLLNKHILTDLEDNMNHLFAMLSNLLKIDK